MNKLKLDSAINDIRKLLITTCNEAGWTWIQITWNIEGKIIIEIAPEKGECLGIIPDEIYDTLMNEILSIQLNYNVVVDIYLSSI